MALDDASIDRILNYVGDVPGTLDKSELRKDILAAWDFYQGYKRADSKGARTERRKHATKIAHKTSELIRLLNDPAGDWVRSRIGRLLSLRERNEPLRERNEDEKIVSLASLTRGLGELLSIVGIIERQCTGTASFREVLNVRPSFWLIGNDLVNVFEKHFAKQAVRARDLDGQPDSPFVRFVTAVTTELGEPVVAETVSKAMSAVAKVKTIAKETQVTTAPTEPTTTITLPEVTVTPEQKTSKLEESAGETPEAAPGETPAEKATDEWDGNSSS